MGTLEVDIVTADEDDDFAGVFLDDAHAHAEGGAEDDGAAGPKHGVDGEDLADLGLQRSCVSLITSSGQQVLVFISYG